MRIGWWGGVGGSIEWSARRPSPHTEEDGRKRAEDTDLVVDGFDTFISLGTGW